MDLKSVGDDPRRLKQLVLDLNDQVMDLNGQVTDLHDRLELQTRQYLDQQLKIRRQEAKFREQVEKYDAKVNQYLELEEKYLSLQHRFFARTSEKLSKAEKEQLKLFNEAEAVAEEAEEGKEPGGRVVVKEHERRKRGRRSLPKDLPREEVVHDLGEEQKHCSYCHKPRPVIGKDDTEELVVIPAQIKVRKHIRLKYGPCDCAESAEREDNKITTAGMPGRMIPHSIASAELLAYIIVSKFGDSLPFYRQQKMFERIGMEISRANLCNWAIKAAQRCGDLMELLVQETRSGSVIGMDETTVQVLHEPGRPACSQSYMWVSIGGRIGKPVILYHYSMSRGGFNPVKLLEGWNGYLQTDGYEGYNQAGKVAGVVHVGCFAHARRKFKEAAQVSKNKGGSMAGLGYIRNIYRIEKKLRKELEAGLLSEQEFLHKRRKQVSLVLDTFYRWLVKKRGQVPPRTALGKAVGYTLGEWDKLKRYLEHWCLTPDNNAVENAIRPFVVGRKNWLFSNTPRGAHSSATLYSLIETAKANRLEPYRYLLYLFKNLPQAQTQEDLVSLLPYNLEPSHLYI